MDTENPAPEVVEAEATPPPPPPEEPKTRPNPIAVSEGVLAPSNANELVAIVEKIAKGGGFPSRFKSPESRMAAYNLAHSLMGARWQLCLNNIADIKGQMTIYGELPGALAEQTKEVKEKRVYVIDKDYKEISVANKNLDAEVFAGVCEIQRKGRKLKMFTYTLDEAKHAGQYPAMKYDKDLRKQVPNDDSPWMKWPKVMLMRKAMAMAIKFEFPDAMVGVPVAEYDFDLAPDLHPIKDVSPKLDRAESLNARFTKTSQEARNVSSPLRSSGQPDNEPGHSEEGGGAA